MSFDALFRQCLLTGVKVFLADVLDQLAEIFNCSKVLGAKTTALHIQGTLYNPCSQNKLREEPWDADLQQARTRLGPKFSSWLCSIDHVSYALPFFLPAEEFPAGKKRGDF